MDPAAVRRATEIVEEAFACLDGPERVARAVGVPLETLRKALRHATGTSLAEAIEQRRVAEARRLLAETDLRTYEIARAVGWGRDDTAARAFHRATGTTMTAYRQAAREG